jgi:hypothetical protein
MTVTTTLNLRPDPADYVAYYQGYVAAVPDGDITLTLADQLETTLALLRSIPESAADNAYAPGKWSIKELVGHVLDGERLFACRALRFSRNDATPLPGFDQDEYVRHGEFGAYTLEDLAREFELVRRSNIMMFQHFSDQAWERRGVANNNPVTVRALAWIMAGHAAHHMEILRSRYL